MHQISIDQSRNSLIKMTEEFISLLPFSPTPTSLLVGDKLPCHRAKIKSVAIQYILRQLNRETWIEGLYARKKDLPYIKRYKNSEGRYKNDFDKQHFSKWVKTIEANTVLCDMENKNVGKGVFVPPKKKLPKGTFIASSGIIKLDPTKEELETKNHCSALQDLNSPERKIVGLIDPENKGGILDLINHAPDNEEIANFRFKNIAVKATVATSNLKSTIKFYNGYAIMGVETFQDIDGGKYGKQLLWSYARPDEYLPCHQFNLDNPILLLFDNRDEHNGEIIDLDNYSLRKINIFLDTGELILRKVALLTRWELMESSSESWLNISTEDSYSLTQSKHLRSRIQYKFLQAYFRRNPKAVRIIIRMPFLKALRQNLEKNGEK